MTRRLHHWLIDERGQDLLEYSLLGATIAFASLFVMNNFDNMIGAAYTAMDTALQGLWEPQAPQP